MKTYDKDRALGRGLPDRALGCTLCESDGGDLVWQGQALRIVLPDEPDFPGFTRVVWQAHVVEMTDLAAADRRDLMEAVWRVEVTMRRMLAPEKVNIASLGNLVPHLHWHVVPRFADDARFPGSPWSVAAISADSDTAAAQRRATARRDALQALLPAYRAELAAALKAG